MRIILAAIAAMLTLPAPARAEEIEQAAIDAAKKEGKVSLYTSFIGNPLHMNVVKTFEQKYGISVEVYDARATEINERVRTEQTTGRFLADVFQNGQATLERLEKEQGILQPSGDLPNAKFLRAAHPATATRAPSYILGYGILANVNLVKPDDEPKSWTDLADPRWKGKIMSDDMRAAGGGAILFAATHDALGADFHRKLALNDIVFSRDVGVDEKRVAAGEFPLRMPQLISNMLLLKGLPVRFVMPREGAPYVRFDLAVLKNAPHPNAARLFINHYLSEQAQVMYANGALIPVIEGAAAKASAETRAFASVKLMGTTKPETQEAMYALAKDIYK